MRLCDSTIPDDSPSGVGWTGVAYSIGYKCRWASAACFTFSSSAGETVLIHVIRGLPPTIEVSSSGFLCATSACCCLCGVCSLHLFYHRDTEHAEVAQRRSTPLTIAIVFLEVRNNRQVNLTKLQPLRELLPAVVGCRAALVLIPSVTEIPQAVMDTLA